MLWVKDVLKLITILLFFLCQNTYSQELTGKYAATIKTEYNTYTFYYRTLTFGENQEFEYYSTTGHTSSDVKGSGHYKVKNKEFILDFDLTKHNREGFTTVESKKSLQDSITIKVQVFYDKKPFRLGYINYMTNEKKFVNTDKEGVLVLRFPKSDKKIEFTHLSMMKENLEVELPLNMDHFVEMHIVFADISSIKDQIWKYKIKRLGKNVLILEDNKGQKQKWKKITPKS